MFVMYCPCSFCHKIMNFEPFVVIVVANYWFAVKNHFKFVFFKEVICIF